MSVYKDKKQGTWYVIFRYVDWTGEKKQKLKRGFRTKKEALAYEAEFKRKANADMDMELGSFVDIYFEDKKNELKENSVRNKKQMIAAHILPYFGSRKMNEIVPADIIQWQNIIHEKNFSKTYERMIQNQITALFNHAQKIYNLENNQIFISKTYYRAEGRDVITTPKTETSNRTITIPEFLKEELEDYINKHFGMPENERLFPIVARTLQKRMKNAMEQAGMKQIRIHDFRHSHVAYLINQGVQPLIIKERLGHRDIKITLNTYGHLYPSQQKQVAEMLNEQRKVKSPDSGNCQDE